MSPRNSTTALYATLDPALSSDPARGVPAPVNYVAYMFSVSMGYFIADLCMVLYFRLPPVAPIVIHHVLATFGFSFGNGAYSQCCWFGCGIWRPDGATIKRIRERIASDPEGWVALTEQITDTGLAFMGDPPVYEPAWRSAASAANCQSAACCGSPIRTPAV